MDEARGKGRAAGATTLNRRRRSTSCNNGNNPSRPSRRLLEVFRQVLATTAEKEGDARMDVLAWMLRDPLRTCLQGLFEFGWWCTYQKQWEDGEESGKQLLSPQDMHEAVQSLAARKIVSRGKLGCFDISKFLWALLDREVLPLLAGLEKWFAKNNCAKLQEAKTLRPLLKELRNLRDSILHPSKWSVTLDVFKTACFLMSDFLASTEGIMTACSSGIARRKFSAEFRLNDGFRRADRRRLQRSITDRIEFLPGDFKGQIVGRQADLANLFLPTADAFLPIVLLLGLSGSGKTKIAVEYATQSGLDGQPDMDRYPGGVVMLRAQSLETLAQSLFDFLTSCFAIRSEHERLWINDIESDQFETICTRAWSHVSCWLRDCSDAKSRWLLVFDAADDPHMLMALPLWNELMEMKHGHVLITSCAQNWPLRFKSHSIHRRFIRGLDEANSMALLCRAALNTPAQETEKKALSCIVGPAMLNGMPSACLKAARYLQIECKGPAPFQQLFCDLLHDPSNVLGWSDTTEPVSLSSAGFVEQLTVWKFLRSIGLKRLARKVQKASKTMTVNELLEIQDPGDQVEHLIEAKVGTRFDRATILDRIFAHQKLVQGWTTAIDRLQGVGRLLLRLRSFVHPFKEPDKAWLHATLCCVADSQVSEKDFNNACSALQQRSLLTKTLEMEPLVQTYVRTRLSEGEIQGLVSALDWPLRQPDPGETGTVLDLSRTCASWQALSCPLVGFVDIGKFPNVWFPLQYAGLLGEPQSGGRERPSKRRVSTAPTNPVAKMGKPSPKRSTAR
eukprot:INCI6232.3.p1 GENE.INCI6232.3~~INCI6232.3.p1  ORF type:complete len:790 (-),score=99.94 INCI6232.3:2794-5163(-)